MYLKTARLIIRPFTSDDAEEMHSLFCLPQLMQPVGMAPALTEIEQTKERLSRWIDGGIHHAVVLADNNKVIGYIVINADSEEGRDDTRELGFALHPNSQRCGYMTETVKAVLDELRNNGIRFVWACCFKENHASEALIRRCGFIYQQDGEYTAKAEHKTYASREYRIDLHIENKQVKR